MSGRCDDCKVKLHVALLDENQFSKLCGSCLQTRLEKNKFECQGCFRWMKLQTKRQNIFGEERCIECCKLDRKIDAAFATWEDI